MMDIGIKRELYSKFEFGDMVARYLLQENGQMILQLVPKNMEDRIAELKFSHGDSLIQAKLLGDAYPGGYAGGVTMRNSQTVEKLTFLEQKQIREENRIEIHTFFEDGGHHRYIHKLGYTNGDYAVDSVTEFVNESDRPATLELLSSFSMGEITPFEKGDATDHLLVHRFRSKWSHEGRPLTETIEELQLEPTWSTWQPNSLRYGQIGSMPVKSFFPFGAVEDCKAQVVWAAQLETEGSWQMEIYRRDSGINISGGQADREFGHWMKNIAPGERFSSTKAILTVCTLEEGKDNCLDYACQRLTHYAQKFVNQAPKSEQHLPVMFNEYCTTWGLPSEENITGILEAIRGHGLEYFVVDCGWFVEEGKHWANGMGDYIPSDKLFPKGLGAVSQKIRQEGLVPGIWFEIDNVGVDAHLYQEEELLLHRDGYVLTTQNRRFLDMRNPKTIEYLTNKVIGQLKEYGFSYMKMDYNDTYGIGCDGAESLGEGLRQDREASVSFVEKVKEEIPDIILENCASGGHKLEPLMMSLCSMASFSDAHECENIPVVAANLQRLILPRQSQIWAVIRKEDSLKRITYTLTNTFLGRMCFSGDVTELTAETWKQIDDGIAFYKLIAPIIKDGYSYFYSTKGKSDRVLTGYQAVIRERTKEGTLDTKECKEAVAVIHVFDKQEQFRIRLPQDCPRQIAGIYRGTQIEIEMDGDELVVTPTQDMEAVAVYFRE